MVSQILTEILVIIFFVLALISFLIGFGFVICGTIGLIAGIIARLKSRKEEKCASGGRSL